MATGTIGQKNKMEEVMIAFKSGKLKNSLGKTVTDKETAIAMSLKSVGISETTLMKAEMFNKIQLLRKQVEVRLQKELAKDDSVEKKIVEFFKTTDKVDDTTVHAFADKLGIDTHEFEEKIYTLLSSFLYGGKGKGRKIEEFDPEEVSMGRLVESEHTSNPYIAEKIVVDHLTEQPDYYSFGKKKGVFDELKKSRGRR